MRHPCHRKQWLWITVATLLMMGGRLAVGGEPEPKNQSAQELREFKQQLEGYESGPQHPTPRERSLEAELAVMHNRAIEAEAALAECQSEVTTLKAAK